MNKQELLRKYIDRDLTPEEEQEALHIIADDPELRSLLRFEQQVKESFSRFPGSSGFDVPEHFADHVMSRIEAAEQPEPVKTISWQEKLEQWIEAIWMPRQIQLRPVYVAAALILLVTGITLPLSLMEQQQIMTPTDPGQSVQAVSEKVDQVLLRFVYIDDAAESVAVAGDFSNWEPVQLDKKELNGETVWTGLVSMSRGEHRYMFVKNGEQWVSDPLATIHQEDGFGNKNAVIFL